MSHLVAGPVFAFGFRISTDIHALQEHFQFEFWAAHLRAGSRVHYFSTGPDACATLLAHS